MISLKKCHVSRFREKFKFSRQTTWIFSLLKRGVWLKISWTYNCMVNIISSWTFSLLECLRNKQHVKKFPGIQTWLVTWSNLQTRRASQKLWSHTDQINILTCCLFWCTWICMNLVSHVIKSCEIQKAT